MSALSPSSSAAWRKPARYVCVPQCALCLLALVIFVTAGCGALSSSTEPSGPPSDPPPPPPLQTFPNTASDDFARPDGNLGSNWSVLSDFGGSDGGIQLLDHAFAPSTGSQTGFPTSVGTWVGGQTFGGNQYAKVQIAAIAPEQSVVAITGATLSGANTIYNYSLTSGHGLQTPQPINITGMADAGNNGAFIITALDTGTFTVANASGVTATNQSSTGISATDSLCGPAVRSTAGVLSGYFVFIGNNSGYVARNNGATDGRVYVVELWKFVNGAARQLLQVSTNNTIPDSVGDTYYLFALRHKVALYKNGVWLAAPLDNSLDSGSPGIIASSATGAGNSVPLGANVGVSGTQFTDWVGSDAPSTPPGWTAQASETFVPLAAGPAPNPPWSQVTGFAGVPLFDGHGQVQFGGSASLIYTGRNWADDQSSSVVVSTVKKNPTSIDVLVRASSSAQTYYAGQFLFSDGFGAGTFGLFKYVNGTATQLASVAGNVNFADVLRVEAVGTTLTLKQNATTVLTATDSSLTGGSPGMTGGPSAYVLFWEGDETASSAGNASVD